jgi:hypothetical protein
MSRRPFPSHGRYSSVRGRTKAEYAVAVEGDDAGTLYATLRRRNPARLAGRDPERID